MRALTVRNPWALTIFLGKDVENRNWYTGVRGPVAIHAGKGMGKLEYEEAALAIRRIAGIEPPTLAECLAVNGKVIGVVDLYGCVRESSSPWFFGKYGFQLRDQRRLVTPIPAVGAACATWCRAGRVRDEGGGGGEH